MKSPLLRSPGSQRGIALISVLAVLVLLTLLIVAFLVRAQIARNSSANYHVTTATRLLSDTVVNMVEAEINDATTYGTSSQATGTAPYTWASQPGAIRVYDSSGTGAGAALGLQKIYRLYSAPALTTTSISDLINTTTGNTTEIPSNWASSPAQWVDLNAPVTVSDPSSGNSATTIYPILDNRNPTTLNQCVQLPGFFVNPIGTSTFPATGTTTLNPPVMPVQWLYALKNGQIVAPTGGSGSTVTFTTPNAPTSTNPIVGRIAYWTDDDTCKVNINTAAGSVSYQNDAQGNKNIVPAPWDTPRYGGCWEDIKLLAEDQPVQGEYQRYPGHPATTLLYNIFHGLNISMPEISTLTSSSYSKGFNGTVDTQDGGTAPWLYTSTLYGFLPRYNDNGGSQSGIANTTGTAAVLPTQNRSRLYTSLGELLYSTNATSASPPVRTLNGTQGEVTTGSPGITTPYLSRQQIETGKFFLTTHSRAPEVTLFGTPRVNMWPVPDTTQTSSEGATMGKTPFDKMLAFCSTTDTGKGNAGFLYYFQRYDRNSTLNGTTLTSNDWSNEPRNQALYGYLQDLTSANIPGYGGNFLTKYGTSKIGTIANERDQILTEMIDYIRCTNLDDHSGTITQAQSFASNNSSPAQVMPLIVTSAAGGSRTVSTTQGLGRLLTLSEVGLHVICTASGTNNLAAANAGNTNIGYSGTGNSGTSVVYNTPQIVAGISATIPVSPVVGSACDPAYVSNLPTAQFLRDMNNNVVDIYNGTPPTTPFPANQTLTTTGSYGGALAALPIGSNQLQAMLVFELASPMSGFDSMITGSSGPSVNIHVTGIHNIQIAGQTPFPTGSPTASGSGPNINGDGYLNGVGATGVQWNRLNQLNCIGGILGFRFPMLSLITFGPAGNTTTVNGRTNGWSGKACLVSQTGSTGDTVGTSPTTGFIPGTHIGQPYRFVSNPFTVTSSGITLGGSGSFNVALEMPVVKGAVVTSVPYQNFTVAFPVSPSVTPTLCAYGMKYTTSTPSTFTSHAPDWWGFDNRIGWASSNAISTGNSSATPTLGWGCVIRGDLATPSGGWGTVANAWSYNNITTLSPTITTAAGGNTAGVPTPNTYGDVFRSVVPKDCDYRLTMARIGSSATPLVADPSGSNPDFMLTPLYASAANMANMLMDQGYSAGTAGTDVRGSLINGQTYGPASAPKVPFTFGTTTPDPRLTVDWDSGMWNIPDGAYANKPDEGNTYAPMTAVNMNIPYQNGDNQATNVLTSYFTPNRMIASPVAFGSLPTGVAEGIPWRTLLFRPQLNRATYTGLAATPKDDLLLDLFTMPVVQPYAISEPFSTAGKINMNYQILPFTHIVRDTGVRAVLGSELIARIPAADAAGNVNGSAIYKGGVWSQTTMQSTVLSTNPSSSPKMARLPLNLDEKNGTLRQFQDKFVGGDIFRSAAEICDLYLEPSDTANAAVNTVYQSWLTAGAPYAAADTGWYGTDFGAVGDNVREHPYGDMYARLTTKSNTYTVYYKVQSLKNPPNADPTQWTEGTGVITGEYRGSTSLERYLDPNNNTIPDFTVSTSNPAITSGAPSLDSFYQWRVVSNTAFVP